MVNEEGESNVSAHRGYLDIVVVDFDIIGLGAPPVFEAEWIQDGATTHDYDTYQVLSAAGVHFLLPDWATGTLYTWDDSPRAIRWFSIPAAQEYYTTANPIVANYFHDFRYSASLDRLVYLAGFLATNVKARLIDPLSGDILASSSLDASASGTVIDCGCLVDINGAAVLVGFSSAEEIFAFYLTTTTVERSYQSIASFGGYSSIQCVTPGAVRGSEFDVWFCADTDLLKVTLTALGTFKSSTVVATLADDLRYAVYDDGDLVVWTDAATVKRINGTTGTVEYTKTVPYQIEDVSIRNSEIPICSALRMSFISSQAARATSPI
ncbi:hypothetical protein AJ88_03645 [Mesorhizobium amorphae CCBAU 01583]|nr:hypothetical protein AJ88_03645 [Mesorhizobium amorphae CCBAU 01583]